MHVLTTKNTGATDYWRFPWLRYKGGYVIDWKPPIVMASLLKAKPDLKFPFVKFPGRPNPEVYYPLEESARNKQTVPISRQFMAMRNIDEALAFANSFGLLGLDAVPRYSGESYEIEISDNGEDLNDWLGEASQLAQAYEVWDLIDAIAAAKKASNKEERQRKEKGLRDLVTGTEQGASVIWPKIARTHPTKKPHWVRPAPLLKPEEIIVLAKTFVSETYNRKMIQMASPMLLLDAKGAFHNYNRPSSLLGALWLEFGEIASGERKQALCESCGKWMDVSGNHSHKRKHDRCVQREKVARWRAKQKD